MRLHAAMSKIAATDAANPIFFANPIIFPQPSANMPARVTSGKGKSKPGLSPIGDAVDIHRHSLVLDHRDYVG